jgi:MFS transporter, MHS family, proline/betaine transporter
MNSDKKMNLSKNKIITAGFAGNILETYDLIIYALMTPFIAAHFFNPADSRNILHAFLILFYGYLARPVGALIFGFISDSSGRKKAIAYSSLLVGIMTTLVGCLPSYSQIGESAVYLLLLLRVAQGIALGGEYTNSIIFLVEHGLNKKRGFMGSWATNGNCVGFLLASIVGALIAYLISHHIIPSWGWRYPFLFAIVGAVFIFRIQYTSKETLSFILENSSEPLRHLKSYFSLLIKTVREKKSDCILIFAILWLSVTFTYLIFIYAPIHISHVNHLPLHYALEINVASLLLLIILTPYFGYLSDRFGRKPFLILASLCFLLFAYPYFFIVSHGNFTEIFISHLILALPAAAFYGIAPVLMVELIPIKVRGVLVGLLYNFSASLIGGSAPVIAMLLIHYTHNPTAPALYLMLSALISLLALFRLKEPSQKTVQDSANYSTKYKMES